MSTMTIYGLDDLEGAFDRDAIKRGELCEITTVMYPDEVGVRPVAYRGRHVAWEGGPRWARVCLTAGAVLIFLFLIGIGTIGGVLWLDSVGAR